VVERAELLPVGELKRLVDFAKELVDAGLGRFIFVFSPSLLLQNSSWVETTYSITMAIIGGSADARGPVLGALFLVGLAEALRGAAPQLYLIIMGLSLVAFVLFAPNGVLRLLHRRRR
jgi:ABC-type branched-subunit amino acid transport system permease subunit